MAYVDELVKKVKVESTKEEPSRYIDTLVKKASAIPHKSYIKYRGLLTPEIIPPTVTTSTVGIPSREPPKEFKPEISPELKEKLKATAYEVSPPGIRELVALVSPSAKKGYEEKREAIKESPRRLVESPESYKHPTARALAATLLEMTPKTPEELAGYVVAGKVLKYVGKGAKILLEEFPNIEKGLYADFKEYAPFIKDKIAHLKKAIEAKPLGERVLVRIEDITDNVLENVSPGVQLKRIIKRTQKELEEAFLTKEREFWPDWMKKMHPLSETPTIISKGKAPETIIKAKPEILEVPKPTGKKAALGYIAGLNEPEKSFGFWYLDSTLKEKPLLPHQKFKNISDKDSKRIRDIIDSFFKEKRIEGEIFTEKPKNLKPTDHIEEQLIREGADELSTKERGVFEFFESKIPSEKTKAVRDMLYWMKKSVIGAEPSGRLFDEFGKFSGSYPSSFPRWYPEVKASSKKEFIKSIESGKGAVFERAKALAEKFVDEGINPAELYSGVPIPKALKKIFGKGQEIHPHERMAKEAMEQAILERKNLSDVYSRYRPISLMKEIWKPFRERIMPIKETLKANELGATLSEKSMILDRQRARMTDEWQESIWNTFKDLKPKQYREHRKLMESGIAEHPEKLFTIADKNIRETLVKSVGFRAKVRKFIEEDLGHDTSDWRYTIYDHFPRMWRGDWRVYKIVGKEGKKLKTETLAIVKGEKAAETKVKELIDLQPETGFRESPLERIYMEPRIIKQNFNTSQLSQKGFWNAINKVADSLKMSAEDLLETGALKGEISIRHKRIFVPQFLYRKGELQGYEDDPVFVYNVLMNRLIRKKLIEPYSKDAELLISRMPGHMKEFAREHVDDMCGKFSVYQNINKIMKYAGPFMSKLKLGWSGITAFVNRLQSFQQTMPEVGIIRMAKTIAKKFTPKGRKEIKRICDETDALAGRSKYYGREWVKWRAPGWSKDLSLWLFDKSEKAVRSESEAVIYDFAISRFNYKVINKFRLSQNIPKRMLYKNQDEMAKSYAIRAMATTMGHYGPADYPALMRSPFGQILMKFKHFQINFSNQAVKILTGRPLPLTEVFWDSIGGMPKSYAIGRATRWLGSNVMIAGVRSLPIPALAAIYTYLAINYPKYPMVNGLLAPFGFDISGRAGVGDMWKYYSKLSDIGGVYVGTAKRWYDAVKAGDYEKALGIWPAARAFYEALAYDDGIYSVYTKELLVDDPTLWDRFIHISRFNPIKQEMTRQLKETDRRLKEQQAEIREKYDKKWIDYIEEGRSLKEMDELWNECYEKGFIYTHEMINNLMFIRNLTYPERLLAQQLPFISKGNKEKFIEMINKVRKSQGQPEITQ